MNETPLWQRVLAFILLPIIIPVAGIAGLFSKPVHRSAEEVVAYLSDFAEGRGRPTDWDDFTSVDIADPELDALRARAANIRLPVDVDGDTELQQLVREAQYIERRRNT